MPGKKSQKTGERKKRSFGLTKMSNDVKTKPSVRANTSPRNTFMQDRFL